MGTSKLRVFILTAVMAALLLIPSMVFADEGGAGDTYQVTITSSQGPYALFHDEDGVDKLRIPASKDSWESLFLTVEKNGEMMGSTEYKATWSAEGVIKLQKDDFGECDRWVCGKGTAGSGTISVVISVDGEQVAETSLPVITYDQKYDLGVGGCGWGFPGETLNPTLYLWKASNYKEVDPASDAFTFTWEAVDPADTVITTEGNGNKASVTLPPVAGQNCVVRLSLYENGTLQETRVLTMAAKDKPAGNTLFAYLNDVQRDITKGLIAGKNYILETNGEASLSWHNGQPFYTWQIQGPSQTVTITDGDRSKTFKDFVDKGSIAGGGGETLAAFRFITFKVPGAYTFTETIYHSGSELATSTTNFSVLPKGTSIVSVAAGKKAFTVKWVKQAVQTSGYEVMYATDKSFTTDSTSVKVNGKKKVSTTVKGLKSGKTYFVKVRTYKQSGGESFCSDWSGVKKVKVK